MMGYNMDAQRTIRLDNFQIPIAALYNNTYIHKDWLPKEPQIIDIRKNVVEIPIGCVQSIVGVLKDKVVYVTKMKLAGECSGSLFRYFTTPVFNRSKGIFEALFIWEDGDIINIYTVINGDITEAPAF